MTELASSERPSGRPGRCRRRWRRGRRGRCPRGARVAPPGRCDLAHRPHDGAGEVDRERQGREDHAGDACDAGGQRQAAGRVRRACALVRDGRRRCDVAAEERADLIDAAPALAGADGRACDLRVDAGHARGIAYSPMYERRLATITLSARCDSRVPGGSSSSAATLPAKAARFRFHGSRNGSCSVMT